MAEQLVQVEQVDEESRWRKLAEEATPVKQMCTVPKRGGWQSALVGEGGQVIAKEMDFVDGRFLAEARVAVLELTADTLLLRGYARYVSEVLAQCEQLMAEKSVVMLPMRFDEWLIYQEVERNR